MSESPTAIANLGTEQPLLQTTAPAASKGSGRLLSLDVFRGITMAGMIMVNNAGDWNHAYRPLDHAEWNGWTPTDLVFPFFLFIVGVAMTFSFDKRRQTASKEAEGAAHSRWRLFEQVVRRTIVLFCLGLGIFAFPDWRLMAPYVLAIVGSYLFFWDAPSLAWPQLDGARVRKVAGTALLAGAVLWFIFDFGYFQTPHLPATRGLPALRVPGVLQRIAVCYFLTSVIALLVGVRGRVIAFAALILGYWWIVRHPWSVTPPAHFSVHERPEALLHAWLDVKLIGRHCFTELPDPEGIISTLGGVATCLLGVLTGSWLRSRHDNRDRLIGLFFAANLLIFAGLCLSQEVPINKKNWTSSYVLLTGGIAMHVLAMCYWLVDVKGWRRWSAPFMVFGTNAILVYVSAAILSRILLYWSHGQVCLKDWIFHQGIASHFATTGLGPYNASLTFALAYVVFWLVLLIPFYRWRIFVRV